MKQVRVRSLEPGNDFECVKTVRSARYGPGAARSMWSLVLQFHQGVRQNRLPFLGILSLPAPLLDFVRKQGEFQFIIRLDESISVTCSLVFSLKSISRIIKGTTLEFSILLSFFLAIP